MASVLLVAKWKYVEFEKDMLAFKLVYDA